MNEWYCKWVSKDMKTRNNTCWEEGVPKGLPDKDGLILCSGDLFHYVKHPLLAVLFKGKHGCSFYTKLYEVKPEGKVVEEWDKCGSTELTLIKELEIPEVTNAQKIAFVILCAKEVFKEEEFVRWANDWLSGKDRSQQSAKAAANTAKAAANTAKAAADAAKAAVYAVYSASAAANTTAAYAAKAATYFANDAAVYAVYSASAAASVAAAANTAAAYAAYAGDATYYANYASVLTSRPIDLISLAQKAMEIQ